MEILFKKRGYAVPVIIFTVFFGFFSCTNGSSSGTYTHPKPRITVTGPCYTGTGTDPLLVNQWHLTEILGDPANFWTTKRSGAGVTIAVVDDSLDLLHDDLCGNVRLNLSYNYEDGTNDTRIDGNTHGTCVAGVAAAIYNNGKLVSGVAPEAKLTGFNILYRGDSIDLIDAYDALTRNLDIVDVYNNSWGPEDVGGLNPIHSMIAQAIDAGLANGRNGKGAVYVWSNGNGGGNYDRSNYDGIVSYYGVISIGAIGDDDKLADYSEEGSNLWVVTLSDGDGAYTSDHKGIYTVYPDYVPPYTQYISNFGGTSSAAPLASGVIALILEENPNLSWRDLRYILATTARQNDSTDPSWDSGPNAANHKVSHKYGFGAIDPAAAIEMADPATWSPLGAMKTFTSSVKAVNTAIPNNTTNGIVSSFNISTSINTIEYIDVTVAINHVSKNELKLVLTSPGGTESVLMLPYSGHYGDSYFDGGNSFTFGVARCLDEDPNGKWELEVQDNSGTTTSEGTLQNWKMKFYGRIE